MHGSKWTKNDFDKKGLLHSIIGKIDKISHSSKKKLQDTMMLME